MTPGMPRIIRTALAATVLCALPACAQIESNVPGAGFDQSKPTPQPATPTPTPTPTLKVYSRETIVDVLVTDDKGQPVRGLTQSDFTVPEDGHPQPIRSFHEYDKTAPPPPRAPCRPTPTPTPQPCPPTAPSRSSSSTSLVTPPDIMERGKQYIADYFRTMPAGTQVAIFDLSPTKDLRPPPGLHHRRQSRSRSRRQPRRRVEPSARVCPPRRTPIAIAGLNQIADYVAGIHGRKNLIWVLTGMPLPITRDGMSASPGAPDMLYVHRHMDLYDLFTREQIAIYPLDTTGVHKTGLQLPHPGDARRSHRRFHRQHQRLPNRDRQNGGSKHSRLYPLLRPPAPGA